MIGNLCPKETTEKEDVFAKEEMRDVVYHHKT